MGKWVVTVAGVAILSVLCDVILPEGQTRKYVKTVFGVVVSLIIIQPIVGLFSQGVNGDFVESGSVAPQEQYLESVYQRQNEYALRTVKQLLEGKGIDVDSIELNSAGDRLAVEVGITYSKERSQIIEQITAAYFPTAKLEIIWST